ncbi:MAG TPA: D-arabinono-1,4-lactone oxidase [Acidimicrobiales bacterium]|nr:D-arabinono-1,4-lactone oxidase [Acidimicrobiales bacterium]
MARTTWTNWAGNQVCLPHALERPVDVAGVVDVVERARAGGRTVRVVGAGHSFTPIVPTDGHLVDLSALDRVLAVDAERGLATVEAGISLAALSDELAARGLALENLGDINVQSLAGATATSTHGTGLRFGNLSSMVAGFRLVTAAGEVVTASPTERPDLLDVGRTSLGALGVVVEITVRVVPAFTLHAVVQPEPLDDVLAELDHHLGANDHFELFWIPHTGTALTKRNRRSREPAAPRSAARQWVEGTLVENVAFGALCRLGRAAPGLVPTLAGVVAGATSRSEWSDRSDRVFASPRRVRFVESEWSVPVDRLAEAVRATRAVHERLGLPMSFPVEVRAVAGDDIPLSTAHGGPRGYVAVHAYRGTPHEEWFRAVQDVMLPLGGRPHWGKLHTLGAAELAPLYPRWSEFQAARAELDPHGTFTTPAVERLLGPAPAVSAQGP